MIMMARIKEPKLTLRFQMSEKDRCYIKSKYAGSAYHEELENNLMNFLKFYENDLPMYCILQRQMYMNIAESPLYFDQ